MRTRFIASLVAWCFFATIGLADFLATTDASLLISEPNLQFTPQLFTPFWQNTSATGDLKRDTDGAYHFTLTTPKTSRIQGNVHYQQTSSNSLAVCYTFIPEKETSLNALFIGTSLTLPAWLGCQWITDQKHGELTEEQGALILCSTTTRSLKLVGKQHGQQLTLTFPEPTQIMLQDNRRWDPSFALRIGYNGATRHFQAGTPYTIRFVLTTTSAQKLVLDAPLTLLAGPDWIPLQNDPNILSGSALDFSQMGFTDAPAGRYGRVVARQSHFEFEKKPGITQRFYGANLCFTANFPDPDMAATLAARFARIGYNTIRLHHHDNELVKGSPDGTTINPDNLARLDALMAACISNGLYVTTDLYVSRRVPWRSIGIDRQGTIDMNVFKILIPVHEGAFENLKTFTRQWLGHVNPYTHRRYADEPALAWLAMINEGNFSNFVTLMPNIPEWRQAWRTWLKARQTAEPNTYADISDEIPSNIYTQNRHTTAFLLFLNETENHMMARLKDFLRNEMNCHALVTDRSSWTNHASDQATRAHAYDYVDDHFYVDHPHFIEKPWRLPSRCDNQNPIKNSSLGAQRVVFTRLLDKPFTITEYNYSGPGRFRGVGGIATGTMAALQDWSGIWRFAYTHNREAYQNPQGSAMGYFDLLGDPLSLAAERASLCLFLRRDLEPLQKSYALLLPESDILSLREKMPKNSTDWPWLSWYARMGTWVADTSPANITWSDRFPLVYEKTSNDLRAQILKAPSPLWPIAGDGAVQIDPANGRLILNTPRTCGGFTETGTVTAGCLTFDVGTTAATVWISALDQNPIKKASRLLLTHLTDVQNSGIQYGQHSRQTLLAWGTLPHLVRNGHAHIRLQLAPEKSYRVYTLATNGRRMGELPTKWESDQLYFTAAVDHLTESASLFYEIVAEDPSTGP